MANLLSLRTKVQERDSVISDRAAATTAMNELLDQLDSLFEANKPWETTQGEYRSLIDQSTEQLSQGIFQAEIKSKYLSLKQTLDKKGKNIGD